MTDPKPLSKEEPRSVGPVTADMGSDEKVIRWAIRYCSDPGAGPQDREWAAIQEVKAKLATIDAQAATIRDLTAKLDDWEEREAAICPEDVGFEEMIAVLSRQLTEARAALAAADGGSE